MLSVPKSNLPIPLTSFVGRRLEVREVRQLVSTVRLLTLTGAGGCGKTRLALQVASGLGGTFPDGVGWVELEPLTDSALLAPTVVKALGLREASNRAPLETLIHFLESKRLLFVLDDCDRLISACLNLVEALLPKCTRLHILCTSREALGGAGEVTWFVPSLSLPESPAPQPYGADHVSSLVGFDAIQLFIERVSAVLPGFRLNTENAPAILEICRRLDGIPLAIELAAARAKVLTVQQIATRLDDRFNLLTAGTKGTLPRHQTLRAAVDWSYDLLTEPERVLLRRLAAFAGGWTLEAAEAVCADDGGLAAQGPSNPISRADVLDLLSHLIDKSLVLAETQHGAEARYYFLETLRQYAAEKLEDAGEATLVRDRHRDWYLRLAEEVEAESRGANQKVWFDRAEQEQANTRTALAWSDKNGAVEAELRIASALLHFWIVRGYLREGQEWLEGALPHSESVPAQVRAKAFHVTGTLAARQGEYPAARQFLEQALELRRHLADPRAISVSLNNLATVAIDQGDYAHARELLDESIGIKRQLGDKTGLAYSLGNLGEVERHLGEYGQALAFYEESLSLLRELDNQETVAMVLVSLGSLHLARREYQRGADLYCESLALAQKVGSKWAIAMCIAGLAAIARARGNPEHAARLLGAAQAQLEAIGSPLEPGDRAEYERNVAATRMAMDRANFATAWAEGRSLTIEQAIGQALQVQALVAKDKRPEAKEESRGIPSAGHHPSTEALRLYAFGPMRVLRGEREVTGPEFGYLKAKELLFYLLCHQAKSKAEIGLALWPEASPQQLRGSLGVHLHHMRRALGGRDWVLFENGRYAFNRALPYWFDLEAFQSRLKDAGQSKAASPEQAVRHYAAAVELYHGDLLSDVTAEWAVFLREQVMRQYLDALAALGELYLEHDRYADAASAYRRAIAQDEYFEAAHRGLMQSYARQGEVSQALRHYRNLEDLMRKELDGEPAPETRELFERLRRGVGG